VRCKWCSTLSQGVHVAQTPPDVVLAGLHVGCMIRLEMSLLQDHRTVYVVFWIGIAFWLLFAVLPSEKLLAMIRRNIDQV